MSLPKRVRNFVFTINNYTEEDCQRVVELPYQYIIFGKEVGESGTPHLQGYCQLQNQVGSKKLAELLPRAHLEGAKGSAKQNQIYCSKQGIYTELGTPKKQGNRNDLKEACRKAIDDGLGSITNGEFNNSAVAVAKLHLQYREPARKKKPWVWWIWGPMDIGKSTRAWTYLYQLYGEFGRFLKDKTKWWEGYDAHKGVLIDEYDGSQFYFRDLLMLLDAFPYRVEYKGGSRQLRAETIIITSEKHPEEIFGKICEFHKYNIGQLYRRIDNITEMAFRIPGLEYTQM